MRKTLTYLLSAAALAAGITAVQAAAPADSPVAVAEVEAVGPLVTACPTAGNEYTSWTTPEGTVAATTTRFLNCGNYIRLDYETFAGSYNVLGYYVSSSYGNPSVYFRSGGSGGPIVNGYDASQYITNGRRIDFANTICYDPCHKSFDGRIDTYGTEIDRQFIVYDIVD